MTTSTRLLLTFGIIAGPIFVVTAGIQAIYRDGYTLAHHPLSLLSLGDLRWIRITNFVVAGVLSLAFAVSVRRVLLTGPGPERAPRLLIACMMPWKLNELGMLSVFPRDSRRRGRARKSRRRSARCRTGRALPLAFISLFAACFVVANRFRAEGHRGAAIGTRVLTIGCLLLAIPVGPGSSWRLFLIVCLAFGWIAALAVQLIGAETRLQDVAESRNENATSTFLGFRGAGK